MLANTKDAAESLLLDGVYAVHVSVLENQIALTEPHTIPPKVYADDSVGAGQIESLTATL
jgi:hypothetical protein